MSKSSIAGFIVAGTFMSILAFCAGMSGVLVAFGAVATDSDLSNRLTGDVSIVNEESVFIDVAENASPAVVSVVITQDLPIYEQNGYWGFNRRQIGTEEQQVGAGTGFIISNDGYIITNRHVVSTEDANYTVLLNDGTQLEAAVIDRDEVLDIAVLKVEADEELPALEIGNSDSIQIGQTVIAIGNSLGQFSNTVSAGIISGLGRSITATDDSGRDAELLEQVIQTDASINRGNSGGPLLNIDGEVIGVNVAVAVDAENIGFAIPIDLVKPVIESVRQFGEIRRPLLGVRYQVITPALAEAMDLPVDYGALVTSGDGTSPVQPGTAAAEAGLQDGDIILSINGVALRPNETTLQTEIQKYDIGDEIELTYLRDGSETTVTTELGER